MCALVLIGAGDAAARPGVEWSGPPDARAGVLVLHGGAWMMTGPKTIRSMRPVARRFAQLGLRVANADYRPGAASLTDARRALRRLGHRRVCIYGESAGGQLAPLPPARPPAIRCVIPVGAVADLARLGHDHALPLVTRL